MQAADSDGLVRAAAEAAQEASLAVCWEQWRSLGASASSVGRDAGPSSIVDPEALVIFSLLIREGERRLDDFLGWFASTGANLLSVQRMYNLSKRFPESAREGFGGFARLAVESGDRRWKRHAANVGELALSPRQGKGADRLALHEPTALVLRLRAGFGVGVKADLLAFLLGLGGERASTREVAEALIYTEVAIRSAAQEMVLARFVKETADRPARYTADPEDWATLLGFAPNEPPRWHYWAGVFAFLADVLDWAGKRSRTELSPYVLSSRARDLCDRHRKVLDTIRIQTPDADRHRGSEYLGAFVRTVQDVAKWTNSR